MLFRSLGEGQWSIVSRTQEELENDGWESEDDGLDEEYDDGSFGRVETDEVL